MKFPDRLRELRKEKGKTQDDLAGMLKVGRSAYGEYERGKNRPTADKTIRLAEYFGVTVEYLIGNTDEKSLGPRRNDVAENLALFVDWVKNGQNEILFKGQTVSDEQRRIFVAALESAQNVMQAAMFANNANVREQ